MQRRSDPDGAAARGCPLDSQALPTGSWRPQQEAACGLLPVVSAAEGPPACPLETPTLQLGLSQGPFCSTS